MLSPTVRNAGPNGCAATVRTFRDSRTNRLDTTANHHAGQSCPQPRLPRIDTHHSQISRQAECFGVDWQFVGNSIDCRDFTDPRQCSAPAQNIDVSIRDTRGVHAPRKRGGRVGHSRSTTECATNWKSGSSRKESKSDSSEISRPSAGSILRASPRHWIALGLFPASEK
jgi:hypothetical protein